ncbi:ABC-type antimicrobial peptide transport system, permease component [Desulfosporosinus acidiphilus SJ4]|uniref:ABC-type antimicrobial peptide transport system, permease component n=1 Tax=Desulfosporosinus acidiphilus (strain DSM 22704 / JCM 16185 / SJ4) TaxID=646529 RepID=I4DBB6_DESAJ|nr:ABC transporter permease [Desulfosporosinus acidiphilus]AFM43090.1 ABC-type antimicrobial peptide transport system, permease component [Desulfosporosinus acidiphilus SJ4]
MSLFEALRGALFSLRTNKLRTGLTMLGIVIGIAAVIAVVTIGLGGKAAIMQEMQKSGVNLFVLYTKSVGQTGQSEEAILTLQDCESLKRSLPQVKTLLPASVDYAALEVNQKNSSAMIVGTTPEFAGLRSRDVALGRFFSEEEYGAERRVVVIDQDLANNLFGAGNPLGQQVMVQNIPCRVIGVLAKDTSAFSQFQVGPQNSYAYVPWGTWSDMFQSTRVDQLEGATYQEADLDSTISSAKRILNLRHGTTDQYDAYNVQQLVQSANKITQILTSIIGLVAGISLLVGGIGIMNIMLVSVTERTHEIGLRKAVGAKERDILLQFLLEATVLALAGGIVGILLGVGSAFTAANLLNWPPLLSGWSILFAVTFSLAVGLFFGYYPAMKAAKLEPITALRYE